MDCRMRAFVFPDDLQPLKRLIQACWAADSIDVLPMFVLRLWLTPGSFMALEGLELGEDTALWSGAGGGIAAFAFINPKSLELRFYIHPQHGTAQLEDEVVGWAQRRAEALSPDGSGRLKCPSVREDARQRALLLRHGFAPGDSYMIRMSRALSAPLPVVKPPPGFSLGTLAHRRQVPAYVDLINELFPHSRATTEVVQGTCELPHIFNWIASAADGRFAAFCQAYIDVPEEAFAPVGWTDPLGTRQAFRRKGLARAVIATALADLKERGMEEAVLVTNCENEGGQRLYQGLGYRVLYHTHTYTKGLQTQG